MWDCCISEETLEKKLVKKAINATLNKHEENMLIEAIKNNPELGIEWGLGPENIPILIESSTQLSFQIFIYYNDHELASE